MKMCVFRPWPVRIMPNTECQRHRLSRLSTGYGAWFRRDVTRCAQRDSAIFSPPRWGADVLGGLALEAVRIPLFCNNPAAAYAV
jgi:hypothetical protein